MFTWRGMISGLTADELQAVLQAYFLKHGVEVLKRSGVPLGLEKYSGTIGFWFFMSPWKGTLFSWFGGVALEIRETALGPSLQVKLKPLIALAFVSLAVVFSIWTSFSSTGHLPGLGSVLMFVGIVLFFVGLFTWIAFRKIVNEMIWLLEMKGAQIDRISAANPEK